MALEVVEPPIASYHGIDLKQNSHFPHPVTLHCVVGHCLFMASESMLDSKKLTQGFTKKNTEENCG